MHGFPRVGHCTPACRVAGCERSACFFSASVRAMRASLVCVALAIAQVASLEPRRWCTRCHVRPTAATIPNVLGQTTHHWVGRYDLAVECARARPRILVLAAPPRAQMRMKLGAQEVRTALRRTHTSLAGVVTRVRAFVWVRPMCRRSAHSLRSCSLDSARRRTRCCPRVQWMHGVCACPDLRR